MDYVEHTFTFSCEGQTLIAITAIPERPQTVGVLVVVGGPQYRIGSHRQFVLLARDLASQGIVCMRFDCVGMGDSTGTSRDFESVASDIRAAVDAFFAQVPALTRIVLWGLCDGASAACLYAPLDARVGGLMLLNPWVRTEQGQATAYLKHYYANRLFERTFWRKVFRGEFGASKSLTSLLRNLVHVAGRLRSARAVPASEPNPESLEFPERMAAALGRCNASVLIVLSENDLTAAEFDDYSTTSRRWQDILKKPDVVVARIPAADHTFSSAAWRGTVSQLTSSWITGREPAERFSRDANQLVCFQIHALPPAKNYERSGAREIERARSSDTRADE